MLTEHQEQVNLVNWLAYNHKELRFFAIPNGEKRNISVAKRLKKEGVSPGVPDLMFPSLFAFIEMKKEKGGRLSNHQKEWLDYLEKCGYKCFVCNGFKEAKEVITQLVGAVKP